VDELDASTALDLDCRENKEHEVSFSAIVPELQHLARMNRHRPQLE
jgi:hypothetical protein